MDKDLGTAIAALDLTVQFLLAREMVRSGADAVSRDLTDLKFQVDVFTGAPLDEADDAARARVQAVEHRIAAMAEAARNIMNEMA